MMYKNDLIVIFGSFISIEAEELLELDSKLIHINSIEDYKAMPKLDSFYKFEVGSEEGVISALANELVKSNREFFDELDFGYILAESSISEEEIEEIAKVIQEANNPAIIFSDNILKHEKSQSLSALIALLSRDTDLEIFIDSENTTEFFELDENQKIVSSKFDLEEVDEIDEFNGVVIYNYKDKKSLDLVGSKQFSQIAKLSDNDKVSITVDGSKVDRVFKLDENLKGTIALNSDFDLKTAYRYQRVKIDKVVENE